MLTLCIDTSGGSGVAVVGERVLAGAGVPDPRRHAEALAPMVEQVLTEAGVARTDLTDVAVGTGPAPFTGLRVGLVTARTLARALGVPVRGAGSLDVLARQALDAGPGAEVVVVTDARRREVYWARYRGLGADDVERVTGPHVSTPAELGDRLGDAPLLAGPGVRLYPDLLPPAGDPVDRVRPEVLARLVRARLARQAGGQPVELGTEPQYLRRPDVQAPGAPKRATGRG